MKVLIVNSYYYPDCNGGSEYCARVLAEDLARKGYDVEVLTADLKNHQDTVNGVMVHYVKSYIKKFINTKSPFCYLLFCLLSFFDFFNLRKYITIIKNGNFDIVHTHAIHDVSPSIWIAAKLCRVPVVHTMHDSYLICPRLFLLMTDNETVCTKPGLLCKIRIRFYKHLVKNVGCFVSPSQQLADNMYVKSEVIPNGIIPNTATAVKKDDGVFRIAYLGSLRKLKGTDLLLEAFEELGFDNAELHIAGEGEMEDLVKKAMQKNKRIKFYGWVDTEKVNEILSASDVMVCPSYSESFGLVIIDAYNNGIPVIASRVGGIPEIVDDEQTGLLFEAGNKDALINCMQRMINDKELYRTCCDGAKEKIKEYSIEQMTKKYLDVYERLVRNK